MIFAMIACEGSFLGDAGDEESFVGLAYALAARVQKIFAGWARPTRLIGRKLN